MHKCAKKIINNRKGSTFVHLEAYHTQLRPDFAQREADKPNGKDIETASP